MTNKEKDTLIALLNSKVFESNDIPGIKIPRKSPGDSEYFSRFVQELKRDERFRPLFKTLGSNQDVVDFYLIEMGEYGRKIAEVATQIHMDCFS
ncbi:MAG: hypothetical protein WCQ32_02595 [bacterium]